MPNLSSQPAAPAAPLREEIDSDALIRALEAIGPHEARLTERFYPVFFERRPDVRELFGVHSLPEQEEMMSETLRSLLGLAEQSPWLAGDLRALGASHAEYGVTPEMYGPFVEILVECTAELCGPSLDPEARTALRSALSRVSEIMIEAASDSRDQGRRASPCE